MKSKLKKRASIIIVLGIFFAISSIYYSNTFLKAVHKEKSTVYRDYFTLDRENLKISAVSERIHIDNNWTAAKAAGICTGEGTYSDPYVIEDFEIDGGGTGSCILIENSDVYFRIEDCTLYNSGNLNAGILLNNTDNGLLIDNDCSSNGKGIRLSNSDNNTISGNSADNNGVGILFSIGYNNTISGNSASYNNYTGIYIDSSDSNTISGNTASHNSVGITIGLGGGDNNDITGNNLFSNLYGIRIWLPGCSDNNISRNVISKNSVYGLEFKSGNNNTVYLNCFIENELNAIDRGWNNRWDNGTIGNYWSNYTGLDADGDGIGDIPYNITGSAGSQDNFPLMECPLPVQDDNGDVIPIELIIIISVISGVAVIGVTTLLLIIRKRKRIE